MRAVLRRALTRAMDDAGVSASELAAACNVSARAVHAWASGAKLPRLARLRQVAIALVVPIDHLVGR